MNLKTRFAGKTYYVRFWDGERLDSEIAVDTETTLIKGHETPDVVTTQVFDGTDTIFYIKNKDLKRFLDMHSDRRLIFAFFPFDHDVIGKHLGVEFPFKNQIDKIYDVLMEYKLMHLSNAGFVPRTVSLASVTRQLLGVELNKDESIRCNFGDYLEDGKVFYDEIPDRFYIYGAHDVLAAYKTHQILKGMIRKSGSKTHLTHLIQLVGQLSLYKTTNRGIMVDTENLEKHILECESNMESLQDVLATYGWVRGRKGCNDIRDSIITDLGIKLPETKTGISTKTEDLEPHRQHHFIDTYLRFIEWEQKHQYLLTMRSETGIIHPRYDTLKNTGRTGSYKPNIQNPPREGGVRELFIARPGHKFFIIDYSFIELCTLAQILYTNHKETKLMDAINSGLDPHTFTASEILGVDGTVKRNRNKAKVLNFGRIGGMGAPSLKDYAKKTYNLELTISEATAMIALFDKIMGVEGFLRGSQNHTWTLTGRKRNNVEYCAEKNTKFQGLAADGAKIAMYNLITNGFSLVGFIHDELIIEEKESGDMQKRFDEACKIMIQSMKQVVPDVAVSVEGFIHDRWTKSPPKGSEKKYSSLDKE